MTKAKGKRGRPHAITPTIEKQLLKRIAAGDTLQEACRSVGIHPDTLAAKRLAEEGFFQASARAILLGAESNLSMVETRLKKSTNRRISVDRELAHHYRWKASKLLSAYRDRLSVHDETPKPLPDELTMLEYARRLAFVIRQGAQVVDAQRPPSATPARPPAALLPAPPPVPVYREVDHRPERRREIEINPRGEVPAFHDAAEQGE